MSCIKELKDHIIIHELLEVGSSSGITVEVSGVNLAGTPHNTFNFLGSGISVADAGGGTADITISGNDITSHTNDTTNPHNTSIVNLDAGSLAQLNSIVTDATLIDTSDSRLSDSRTPTVHASSHNSGQSDALAHDSIAGSGSNSHLQVDNHISDSTIHFTQGDIDHGTASGLNDDDHTQYHNDTRGDARYHTQTEIGSNTIGSSGANLVVLNSLDATSPTLQMAIDGMNSSQYYSGGIISENGTLDGTVDVTECIGYIKTVADNEAISMAAFTISSSNANALSSGMNFICADYNGGTPALSIVTIAPNRSTVFTIGGVYKDENDHLYILQGGMNFLGMPWKTSKRFFAVEGLVRASGLVTSESGTEALGLDITAGVLFRGVNEFSVPAYDTGDTKSIIAVDQGNKKITVVGDIISYLEHGHHIIIHNSTGNDGTYHVESSVFTGGNTEIIVEEAILDATVDGYVHYQTFSCWHYDHDTTSWVQACQIGDPAGALIDVNYWNDIDHAGSAFDTFTSNRYGVHWIYTDMSGRLHLVYGQGNYTLGQVSLVGPPVTVPDIISTICLLIAKVVFQEGAANIYTIEYPWTTVFASTGATDHGGLAGLSDDDHTQYHNDTRGDARYYTQTQVDIIASGVNHGDLENIGSDDHHTEVHNHDARYYTETEIDSLKLDDLASPDDNTDLDASVSTHGLLPKLDNNSSHFLDGQGNWATVSGIVPSSHASSHQNSGADEINVAGLSGELADNQPPKTHASDHRPGDSDALATATPGAIEPDDSAAEGSAASFARSDHTHGIVAAVVGTIESDDAAQEGSATSFARSDHQHAIVTAAPSNIGTSNAEGSANSFSRSDHTHNHAAQTSGTLHAVASISAAGFQSLSNPAASILPTVNDDVSSGYEEGSRWEDITADDEYVCLDNTNGAAVWKKTTPEPEGEGSADDETSTTVSIYLQKLRVTTGTVPAGDYKIKWTYEYAAVDTKKEFYGRVQVDDFTTLNEQIMAVPAKHADTIWYIASGFGIIYFAAGSHNLDMDYHSSGNKEALIRRARITWRKMP